MPCEHYKGALIEAVASGVAPQDELRAHLAECVSCRSAFDQEQALFAAIDSRLHAAASAEVPPSLLPRVRAELDQVRVAARLSWLKPLVFAFASLALAFLIFLMAKPHQPTPENVAKQSPAPVPAPAMSGTNRNLGKVSTADTQIAFSRALHSHAARNSTTPYSAASSNPEVLVPPDEREAFARFVAVLNEHSDVGASLLAKVPEKKEGLAAVEPLQIHEIEIKPLEATDSETSDGAGEKR